jgi:hypothetical protein
MSPQVIHFFICDGVSHDRRNLLRLNINGLQVRIRTDLALPVRHNFCAVAMMVGYQGRGEIWFRRNPDELYGFRSQVTNCTLPAYGRYRLELWLSGDVIAVSPFWLLPKV